MRYVTLIIRTKRLLRNVKLKIVNQRFRPYTQDQSGFPIRIEVADEKGNKAVYKR